MDVETKKFLDSLTVDSIPWHRMITAYGTAENYPKLLTDMENVQNLEEWKNAFRPVSDFEHQSTMLPPAPFALVFILRILDRMLGKEDFRETAEEIIGQMTYYAEVCADIEKTDHAEPFADISQILSEDNLLPEKVTDEVLDEYFEDPDAISEEMLYSCYFYSEAVLSLIPEMLDKHGVFREESRKLKEIIKAFDAG